MAFAYKKLAEAQQEEACPDGLAGQAENPTQTAEDLRQTGQDEETGQQKGNGPTPKSDVDVNGPGGQMAHGEDKQDGDPIAVGIALGLTIVIHGYTRSGEED
jgi:hypothetical protein